MPIHETLGPRGRFGITYACGHTMDVVRTGGVPAVGDLESCPTCGLVGITKVTLAATGLPADLVNVVEDIRRLRASMTPRELEASELGAHLAHFEEHVAHGEYDLAIPHGRAAALLASRIVAVDSTNWSWQPVDLPPNDGDDITFLGATTYAARGTIRGGYNAADILAKLSGSPRYFNGWTILKDASGAPKLWTSMDPLPSWDPEAARMGTPPSGESWLSVQALTPAGGDVEQRARSPFPVGFIYRLDHLWMAVRNNCPPPAECPKPKKPSYVLPVVGGAIAGAALTWATAWAWRRWGARPKVLSAHEDSRADIQRYEVTRIHLDRGGYTSNGVYFGVDGPLYYVYDMVERRGAYIRARNARAARREAIPNLRIP